MRPRSPCTSAAGGSAGRARARVASTAGSRSTACTCGSGTTRTRSASCASPIGSSIGPAPTPTARSRTGRTPSAPPAASASESSTTVSGSIGSPDSTRTGSCRASPTPTARPLTPAELVQRALRLLGDFGNSLFADAGSTGAPAVPSPLVLSTDPVPPAPVDACRQGQRGRVGLLTRDAVLVAALEAISAMSSVVSSREPLDGAASAFSLSSRRDRGDPPAHRARRACPRRRRDPPHVALPRPRARDRARHRRRRAHDPPRGLRRGRRRGLPRMADAARCGAGDHRVTAGPGRVRPRVRLRARRRRAPAVRGRHRSAAVGEDVLRLPRRRLLEDDRGHGRRRLRTALRRAARPRGASSGSSIASTGSG